MCNVMCLCVVGPYDCACDGACLLSCVMCSLRVGVCVVRVKQKWRGIISFVGCWVGGIMFTLRDK